MKDQSRSPSFDEGFQDTIEREHDALKEILKRLQTTTDLRLLLELLEQLRALMKDHFAREEAPDGLYELMESLAPSTVASLQNILGEHRVLMDRVDRAMARARQCLEGPVAEVLEEVATLAESMRDHESRESSLFTDAVFTDLGRSS